MYKNINADDFLSDLDDRILNVLEINGFPVDELGTYLYKDVIRNAVLRLVNCKNSSEIFRWRELVSSPYSSFYFDIANSSFIYYGIGNKENTINNRFFLEEFHNIIRNIFNKTDIGKKKKKIDNFHVIFVESLSLYIINNFNNRTVEDKVEWKNYQYKKKPKFNKRFNIV